MIVHAKPLTPEAFAPFGQVLMGPGEGPERYAFAACMQNERAAARPNMTFMRVNRAARPIRIKSLERHVYSNQTFIPLNGTCQLVAVCPSDENGRPTLERLLAFIATGAQAVNYNANTWHAPRTAIRGPGEFIMFRWDDGTELDTESWPLKEAVEIDENEVKLMR
ncbi:MAG: ureidoglycolate lyase [Desulfobacterales bacterium]|jgi:ureidoglycolate lyase